MKRVFTILFIFSILSIKTIAQEWHETQIIKEPVPRNLGRFGQGKIHSNVAMIQLFPRKEDTVNTGALVNQYKVLCYEKDSLGIWNYSYVVQPIEIIKSNNFFLRSLADSVAVFISPQDPYDLNWRNSLTRSGAVYIYTRDANGKFTQYQRVVARDRELYAEFGRSVGTDGNAVIVGAHQSKLDVSGSNPIHSSGSAYVFEKNQQGNWFQSQKLVPKDRDTNDLFGSAVAIYGNYAFVGSRGDGIDTIPPHPPFYRYKGAVHVFKKDAGGTWKEIQKIVPSDVKKGDNFGSNLAIEKDILVVGVPDHGYDEFGKNQIYNSGAVYVYKRDSASDKWIQSKKIVPPARYADIGFGHSLSIHNRLLAIGAGSDDKGHQGQPVISNTGSVYLYHLNEAGVPMSVKKIVSSDRQFWSHFGVTVSIHNQELLVGEPTRDERIGNDSISDMGRGYFYSYYHKNIVPKKACNYYVSHNGKDTIYSSGVVVDSLKDQNGIDSLIFNQIDVTKLDVSLKRKHDTLFSNESSANSYNWVECPSYTSLSMNSSKYTVNQNGSYAVIIDKKGCIDTSACLSIANLNIVEPNMQTKPVLFPNPTNGQFTVSHLEASSNDPHHWAIFDRLGKCVARGEALGENLDLTISLPIGVYTFNTISSSQSWSTQLIVVD